MKTEKIKPIPQYIVQSIKREDKKLYPTPSGKTRFYSYLTKNDGELVKITVAVKNKYKKWHYKQVAVHGIDSKVCFVKDMCLTIIAGYTVGWYEQELTKHPKWYESTDWGWADDKYFDPYSKLVNKEYLAKFPEFKYSAYDLADGNSILQYLRIYRQYPITEYLLKLGVYNTINGKTLLTKATKDKTFRKWIAQKKEELSKDFYYVNTILKAFKEKRSLSEIQAIEKGKKEITKYGYEHIKEVFQNDLEDFFSYISKQHTSISTYNDYLRACEELGLDMTIEKNRYPHDFTRWHAIRIDEYESKRAEIDAEKRKELYKKFASIAEKYLPLQRNLKDDFVCIIAKSPAELIREGKILSHCVGGMGYDQKFAREETLIFFIRPKNDTNTPFVTMEYSLSKHCILQCHGKNNQRPSQNVMDFIENKWLPYATKKLRKIAA